MRLKKLAREAGKPVQVSAPGEEPSRPRRTRVTQYVMNLPDSAITFLGAFRGLLSPANVDGGDLSGLYDDSHMPMVHCYCFTREAEPEKAELDIRQVSRVHATNKRMICHLPRTPHSESRSSWGIR